MIVCPGFGTDKVIVACSGAESRLLEKLIVAIRKAVISHSYNSFFEKIDTFYALKNDGRVRLKTITTGIKRTLGDLRYRDYCEYMVLGVERLEAEVVVEYEKVSFLEGTKTARLLYDVVLSIWEELLLENRLALVKRLRTCPQTIAFKKNMRLFEALLTECGRVSYLVNPADMAISWCEIIKKSARQEAVLSDLDDIVI